MAYRYGNRDQISLLPSSIEDYVLPDDPVRVYDVFVDSIDLSRLGITLDEKQVGNCSYDPVTMLKLLVYGYSYGIRSSRKLERALYHNLSFIWLSGGLRPDHKTISNFRRQNCDAIKNVLRECARICMRLGLIEGNTLFVDGTKLRANASLSNSWTPQRCKRALEAIDHRIEQVLSECDNVDKYEEEFASAVHMNEELIGDRKLREKITTILNELEHSDKSSLNTVDPDCIRTRSSRGAHAGYNAQIVVDDCNGLIVNSDITSNSNDAVEFAEQIEQAAESLGKAPKTAVADAGYHNIKELKKVSDKGISVVVPSPVHNGKNPHRYHREGFIYDKVSDTYTCPQGHTMHYFGLHRSRQRKRYRIADPSLCLNCKSFGVCTTSSRGRWINRHLDEDLIQMLVDNYINSEPIYARRKETVELPFGHFKSNMNFSNFLLRGIKGVQSELSLIATSFNITRMINILGVQQLCTKLV